jgi:hypothetical protein
VTNTVQQSLPLAIPRWTFVQSINNEKNVRKPTERGR